MYKVASIFTCQLFITCFHDDDKYELARYVHRIMVSRERLINVRTSHVTPRQNEHPRKVNRESVSAVMQ